MSRPGVRELSGPGALGTQARAAVVDSRSESRTLRRFLLAILGFYAVLGLMVLAPEAVYSGDIGVKYVQARALATQRFTSLAIPYPGEFLDPGREFFPIRPPFVMTVGQSTQAIYSPVSAVLQGAAAHTAGIRGLIAVSIIAAGVILWASWRIAPRPYGAVVLVVLGFGGPLWFYGISGWEHAPAVAFSTAAFACATAWPSRSAAYVAGALLGSGAALRDEVLLLLPGLLVALWWCQGRRHRSLMEAVIGTVMPLAAAAVVEVWWFGRPVAAHLRHAVHLLQSALHVTSESNPEVPVLEPLTLAGRWETVVNYWLFGSSNNTLILAFAAALVVALLVRRVWRTPVGILVWLAAVAVVAAGDLHEVLTAPKWLAGMFRLSPYFALAFVAAPSGATNRWPRIAQLTTAAYLGVAFVGVDTTGGKSLGPRLLLPLVPLLTVAAVIRTGEYLRQHTRTDRAVGGIGALLMIAAVVFHLGGTLRAYYDRNSDDSSSVLAVSGSPERVVVADDPFTAQLLFPLYYRKIILLADSPALGARLGTLLAAQRVPSAILVSRQIEPRVSLAPLRVVRIERRGRMVLQYWSR